MNMHLCCMVFLLFGGLPPSTRIITHGVFLLSVNAWPYLTSFLPAFNLHYPVYLLPLGFLLSLASIELTVPLCSLVWLGGWPLTASFSGFSLHLPFLPSIHPLYLPAPPILSFSCLTIGCSVLY